jgi:membrane protease YdiL (CAAX protease family)
LLQRPWIIAAVTLAVLIVVNSVHEILSSFSAYRELHRTHPFYFAESLDKIGGVVVCCLAVWLMRRTGLRGICRELGLSNITLTAMTFGVGASLPMLLSFAITRGLTPHIDPLSLLFLTVFSPIVEEIEFRGFGVRQLQRGTHWPFWAVVWPSAILSGYGHVEQGQSSMEMAGLFLLTGTGGVVLAWLVYRWQTLWVAVVLHICMNLWWELFSVSTNAVGGWFPFLLQALTIILAILGTLRFTHSNLGASQTLSANRA